MNNDYLIFGSPQIEREEIDAVVSTLESGWIGTGPRVQKFEDNFKSYKKARNAVAVSSCTAALHLSLLASQLNAGDEVGIQLYMLTSGHTIHGTSSKYTYFSGHRLY